MTPHFISNPLKNSSRAGGWGATSVKKVLALQAGGPKIYSQNPCKNVWPGSSPSTGGGGGGVSELASGLHIHLQIWF